MNWVKLIGTSAWNISAHCGSWISSDDNAFVEDGSKSGCSSLLNSVKVHLFWRRNSVNFKYLCLPNLCYSWTLLVPQALLPPPLQLLFSLWLQILEFSFVLCPLLPSWILQGMWIQHFVETPEALPNPLSLPVTESVVMVSAAQNQGSQAILPSVLHSQPNASKTQMFFRILWRLESQN